MRVYVEYREQRLKLDQRQADRVGRGEEAILLVEVISGRAIHSSDEAKIINCNKNLVDKAT